MQPQHGCKFNMVGQIQQEDFPTILRYVRRWSETHILKNEMKEFLTKFTLDWSEKYFLENSWASKQQCHIRRNSWSRIFKGEGCHETWDMIEKVYIYCTQWWYLGYPYGAKEHPIRKKSNMNFQVVGSKTLWERHCFSKYWIK